MSTQGSQEVDDYGHSVSMDALVNAGARALVTQEGHNIKITCINPDVAESLRALLESVGFRLTKTTGDSSLMFGLSFKVPPQKGRKKVSSIISGIT